MARVAKPIDQALIQATITQLEAETKFPTLGALWNAVGTKLGYSPTVVSNVVRYAGLKYTTEKGKVGRQGMPKTASNKTNGVDLSVLFDTFAAAGFPIVDSSCILTSVDRSDDDNNKIRRAIAALRTTLKVPAPGNLKPKMTAPAPTETAVTTE